MAPISLRDLRVQDQHTCLRLRDQLIRERYAVISLDTEDSHQTLEGALRRFEPNQTFRFPARDGDSCYDDSTKRCFEILYEAAVVCTRALWSSSPELSAAFPAIQASVGDALEEDFTLFSEETPHAPFSSTDAPFGHTFFNIFNYDHGMLNEHKDRGVVTAIYIEPGRLDTEAVSQLWVGRSEDDWVAMDSLVERGQLVIFVGEELEAMAHEVGLDLLAVNHCVRVEPRGDYVSYSHSRRDPDALPVGNRRSAALVLCS